MARFFRKRIENKGQPPGALVFIGTQKVDAPSFEYYFYNEKSIQKGRDQSIKEIPPLPADEIHWINLEGVHDAAVIQSVGEHFDIHSLVLEDLMNTGQRANLSSFENCLFITIRMLVTDGKKLHVQSEQLSFVLFDKLLLSVQERNGDTFDAVRNRLENGLGRIRKSGPDYLLYTLLDSVVDNYIYLIEEIGSQIDDLELQLIRSTDQTLLERINAFKRELHFMAKVVKPAVLMLRELTRSDSPLITKSARPYYKDLYGLAVHALESIESYRVVLNDYLNGYHLNVSTKMNDIMRVLTVFSAIFIPLTFVAGVYGMNFDHIPELHYRWAYPVFWSVILVISLLMLYFFHRKKWL